MDAIFDWYQFHATGHEISTEQPSWKRPASPQTSPNTEKRKQLNIEQAWPRDAHLAVKYGQATLPDALSSQCLRDPGLRKREPSTREAPKATARGRSGRVLMVASPLRFLPPSSVGHPSTSIVKKLPHCRSLECLLAAKDSRIEFLTERCHVSKPDLIVIDRFTPLNSVSRFGCIRDLVFKLGGFNPCLHLANIVQTPQQGICQIPKRSVPALASRPLFCQTQCHSFADCEPRGLHNSQSAQTTRSNCGVLVGSSCEEYQLLWKPEWSIFLENRKLPACSGLGLDHCPLSTIVSGELSLLDGASSRKLWGLQRYYIGGSSRIRYSSSSSLQAPAATRRLILGLRAGTGGHQAMRSRQVPRAPGEFGTRPMSQRTLPSCQHFPSRSATNAQHERRPSR
ncbi:predicted protein [Uncinocarpus reesii 1704]|uniref:Uncharacterized protein n=1 Tax=Uncinocarpus reesii (strain UAMH 1704) TaxID=336963 RepID=C4JKA7_UNCRE|nr:uncharacterized protein UREG_02064 [Uncinocarpus reesii 1704]EEP77215.1 predicted protein [Uncinocarpus reesii 1704]